MKIKLSQGEFKYLIRMFGMENVPGFENASNQEQDTSVIEGKNILLSKKYIIEDENGQIKIFSPLFMAMKAIQMCNAVFCAVKIEKEEIVQRFAFYFYLNKILLVEQKEKYYEIVELPSLSVAIGLLANRIKEFKNTEAKLMKEISIDQLLKEGLTVEGEAIDQWKQWLLTGWDRDEKDNDCYIEIIETEKEQIMIEIVEIGKEQVKVKKPDKKELINTCVNWFRKVYDVM